MNRHELGDQIAQEALTGSEPFATTIVVVLQKRPYTGVEVEVRHQGKTYHAVGFSKVAWPDKWDEQYGLEIAVKKAAHDVARQICEAGELVAEVVG